MKIGGTGPKTVDEKFDAAREKHGKLSEQLQTLKKSLLLFAGASCVSRALPAAHALHRDPYAGHLKVVGPSTANVAGSMVPLIDDPSKPLTKVTADAKQISDTLAYVCHVCRWTVHVALCVPLDRLLPLQPLLPSSCHLGSAVYALPPCSTAAADRVVLLISQAGQDP